MPEPPAQKERPPSDSDHDVLRDAKIIEVSNTDYALVLSTGPQLSPTSWRSLQLFAILLISFMASLSNGFDAYVMSAVNGMEQYLRYFGISGLDAGGGVGTTTAIIFAIYPIGGIVGVAFAGPTTDLLGRRGGMESLLNADAEVGLGSLLVILGAIVVTVAKNVDYLLAGRFVLGFGVAISTTAAPAYVVEMSPPQWRGRLAALYNTFFLTGAILCTGVTIATGKMDGTVSWRAPLAIQIAPAGILLIFVYFIPESPRWLLSVGRGEEARSVLAKYHGNDDENAPLVQLEWKEFQEAIKLDASDKRWWDYSELFNTRNRRYRTFMMLLMAVFGQWSGNGLGYFLTILFQNAGVKSQERRLILNFANTLVSAAGALLGTSLCDKLGPRTVWFWGTFTCTGMLAIVTGCTAEFGSTGANPAGANAAIAFIFLFGFVYSVTYTPLQALYPAECLEYNARAKGMSLYTLAVSCAAFVNAYAGPIALGRITWKYYLVFLGWDIFECAVIYFCAVETKGRTLEELNEIFEAPNRVKASVAKHRIAIVEKAGKPIVVSNNLV